MHKQTHSAEAVPAWETVDRGDVALQFELSKWQGGAIVVDDAVGIEMRAKDEKQTIASFEKTKQINH
jgi:hypothetical protein